MKKRIFALIAACLAGVFALSLVGCKPDDAGEGEESGETAGEVQSIPVDIISGGATTYTIVRNDFKDSASVDSKSAVRLRRAITEATGVEIAITTDWDNDVDNSARAEILVGETNRPLSAKAAEGLSKKEYRILTEGNKVAIVGGSDRALEYGVSYFIATYLPGYTEGTAGSISQMTVPAGTDIKEEYVLIVKAQGEGDLPRIIETKYPTDDILVADIIATDEPYGADPTGVEDSTKAIQQAINKIHSERGGTVYLPAGKYRITGTISIPEFVTLRGEWQDPDVGDDYGTIILADVASDDSIEYGLFDIGGSAGVKGLTIFYPNQDINDVKPYPYTFYIRGQGNGYMLQSIERCTVINGYRGIACTVTGANAHEMLTVDTLKGTFLKVGAELYNSADVGTSKNIWFDNSYWANAPAEYNPPKREDIDAYTRANGVGMIIGDLEWTQFSNVKVSNYKTGIHIVPGFRIQFAGAFYNLDVRNCDIGLQIDEIDTRWGMNVAYSHIEGSEYSIVNKTGGMVKLADVELVGELDVKKRFFYEDTDDLTAFEIKDYNTEAVKPKSVLYVFNGDTSGEEDNSGDLQEFIDSVNNQGGGIVYLPAGYYRLDAPITVHEGIQLRGAGSLPTRDQGGSSNGTLIISYYGENNKDPDDGEALVTLMENAGVRNIRFVYPENNPSDGKVEKYNYTIRGKGDNVYAVNVAISAAWNGIDVRGCNNAFIKKLISSCFNNTMRVGNSSGNIIEGCLQNATVMLRSGYLSSRWSGIDNYYTTVFNEITRPGCEYVISENTTDLLYYNSFSYGVNSFFASKGDKNLRIINVGADNIGGTMVEFEEGDATVINMMRYNVESYSNKGCSLAIYNRLTINEKTEENIKER